MRIWLVAGLLAGLVLLPFLIWGSWFELALDGERAVAWLRAFGLWAAIVGVAVLVADLVLPLPASGIMAALGVLYGPLIGGLLAALGNFLSGVLAYGLCRRFGRAAMRKLIGDNPELNRFERSSSAFIAGSRALPVLPEVTACMAGLYAMPWPRFATALALGAAVTGFGFAALGHQGRADPTLIVLVATALPPLLLAGVYLWRRQVPRIER